MFKSQRNQSLCVISPSIVSFVCVLIEMEGMSWCKGSTGFSIGCHFLPLNCLASCVINNGWPSTSIILLYIRGTSGGPRNFI